MGTDYGVPEEANFLVNSGNESIKRHEKHVKTTVFLFETDGSVKNTFFRF